MRLLHTSRFLEQLTYLVNQQFLMVQNFKIPFRLKDNRFSRLFEITGCGLELVS